jgi:predicted RNase H-like nuclease (RuvC/YqgF family)
MRVNKWLAASMILPGLCLAALPVFARQQQQQNPPQQQSGDPVADAARKAREKQKAEPKPKKVYTEDDIPPRIGSSGGTTTPGQAASGAQGSADKTQGAAADKTQGAATNGADAVGGDDAEKAWRKRFAEQRDKIATAEKELDILQRESQKTQVQYYSDPQKALMEQNSRKDVNDVNAKIDQKKQEIANLKQQLADLEDELRKSGGDVGWAR